eukprot:753813-Hanusia_phi.AAC.3
MKARGGMVDSRKVRQDKERGRYTSYEMQGGDDSVSLIAVGDNGEDSDQPVTPRNGYLFEDSAGRGKNRRRCSTSISWLYSAN